MVQRKTERINLILNAQFVFYKQIVVSFSSFGCQGSFPFDKKVIGMEGAKMDSPSELYHQRAQILLKLLNAYLTHNHRDLCLATDLAETKILPLALRKEYQTPIADFLRKTLQCKITMGKDRFGQANGYLMISLNNERLNQTGFYSAKMALHKLEHETALV